MVHNDPMKGCIPLPEAPLHHMLNGLKDLNIRGTLDANFLHVGFDNGNPILYVLIGKCLSIYSETLS